MRTLKIAAAVMALTALFAGTANANIDNVGKYSTAYVDGNGSVTDDFGDHYSEIGGSLCNGCSNSWNTDTVVLWQSVLVADGYLSHSSIDGKFGPGTRDATRKWQTRYGLSADGKVGPATWRKLDDQLRTAGELDVYYYGREGLVNMARGYYLSASDGGAYQLYGVRDHDGDHATYFNGSRIQHKKRTITIESRF